MNPHEIGLKQIFEEEARLGQVLTIEHDILIFPDPILSKQAVALEDPTGQRAQQLAYDMMQTAVNAGALGLAANQVGRLDRVVVLSSRPTSTFYPDAPVVPPFALVNPVIEDVDDRLVVSHERCYSLPGVRAEVLRPERMVVSGFDQQGNARRETLEGLLAFMGEHEINHLDGLLFTDLEERLLDLTVG